MGPAAARWVRLRRMRPVSHAERVLFVNQPAGRVVSLFSLDFLLSRTMAFAPFRLEQGWTSKAGTDRLFRVWAPCLFAFVLRRASWDPPWASLVLLVVAP